MLVACGGGGADTTPLTNITAVKVVGDSLSDSGTFGYKFSVQGAVSTGVDSTPLWVERVATSYGQTLCPHYASSDKVNFASQAGCTNYAVGGGRINNFTAPTSPVSITQQLKDAGAAGYGASDLLLVDGGSNDAADLIGAYLKAASDGGVAYKTVLGTVLDAATLQALLTSGPNGAAQAGGAYMKALAVQFAATLKANALDKGATHVAILNVPDILGTPRFKMVLGSLTAAKGATASAQAAALFDTWVQAFNAQLAASFAGDNRVVIADFNDSTKDQARFPAQYELTNITTPVCPATGRGGDGLPTYTFSTCMGAALSAMPPADAAGNPDWWKHYAYADSFHPTPYVHQLMGQLVSRSLSQAGWL
ncbi:SGNH/GDSL hydrolase family protein [Simplicispira psychrophila]|uniref:SGNH/GDSL hydrolase family protein n=1 Tax=Simplicispira psychrophila TaxID=80882 RepID=UPI0006909C52|nr:SGNH/GDSL hydrolase family protein [Simplicispira psychrophila]